MTVTRDQAQLLTTLAIACRPYRAPTWDEAGVMAAIAKMKDWSLHEVALRVIVAAADREAQTPGVIATQEIPAVKPAMFKPTPWEPDKVCTTCSRPEAQCKAVRHADDDHPFISRAANARDTERPAEAVHAIVGDLRERTGHEPPPRPQPETTTAGTDHVAPIREALTTTTTRPDRETLEGANNADVPQEAR